MKAEELIEEESFIVVNTDYPIINKDNALKAVEIAREEMRKKAIEAFTHFIDDRSLDDDQAAHYIDVFKELLEEK